METKTKKTKAQERNRTKFRLLGICLDKTTLTNEEIIIWGEVEQRLNLLKKNWDLNSKKLGFNVRRFNVKLYQDEEYKGVMNNLTLNQLTDTKKKFSDYTLVVEEIELK